ncbi:IclR family transcriptional regulator [Streptomyces sp. NPDC005077]|uniref:IclR family transcriptional regulator n=1 Tax=Streptomyces sp. NPDC005077 TaxID=3154292 RepID=UPI0033B0E3B5
MMLGSVSKAGRVLGLFTPEAPEWGVSEVATAIGIAKSSAHALLVTLDDIGLVRRLAGGRYRLGWRILELNRTLRHSTDFLGPHRARLQRVAVSLGATVHLAALQGREVVYLDKIVAPHGPVLAESGVGLAMPAHCTALGKVLLASLGPVDADAMLALHGLPRRTASTITDAVGLQEELARIRALGYGLDLEEAVSSVCCVAAPIRDRMGEVEAAVSLTLPAGIFHDRQQQVRETVRSAAEAISRLRRDRLQLATAG